MTPQSTYSVPMAEQNILHSLNSVSHFYHNYLELQCSPSPACPRTGWKQWGWGDERLHAATQ